MPIMQPPEHLLVLPFSAAIASLDLVVAFSTEICVSADDTEIKGTTIFPIFNKLVSAVIYIYILLV